jgi:hypothetical protein
MSLYQPIKAETIPDGYIFAIEDNILLALVKDDLEQDSDLRTEALGVQSRLNDAFRARAQQTSAPFLVRAILLSIVGTVVVLILLKILFLIRQKLLSALTAKAETHSRLIVFGFDLRRRTVGLIKIMVRVLLISTFLFLLYSWITFLLNRFPYTRPWGLAARGFLVQTIQNLFSGFVTAVPGIITVLMILGIIRVITKVIRDFFDGVAAGNVHLPGIHMETADATRPLSTKIVNLKKEEFTLPNTVMVSSVIKNYSRQATLNGLAASTMVTIGYDAPWRQVHEMLIGAASKTPGVRKEPEPFVLQTALSDFYVEYTLIVHLEDVMKRLYTLSLLHQNIQDAFNEGEVQIMSPHFEGQPEKPVFVPKSNWFPKTSSSEKP